MIKLTSQTRIFLGVAPVGFRKGLDGFIGKVQTLCKSKELIRSGAMFVFTNRARTLIRVLSYDGSGFWLATKRLQYALDHDLAIDNADVLLLIQAIQTLDALQARMEDQDITLRELKTMIGMLPSSERRASSNEGNPEAKGSPRKKRKTTKGSKPRTQRKPQVIEHHKLDDVSKGDACEECGVGIGCALMF